ncbi:MAG TPA: hypothetical protein VF424_00720 [Vicinamibacterales bacterium]
MRQAFYTFLVGVAILAVVALLLVKWPDANPLSTCSGGPVPEGGYTFMTTGVDGEPYCTKPPR